MATGCHSTMASCYTEVLLHDGTPTYRYKWRCLHNNVELHLWSTKHKVCLSKTRPSNLTAPATACPRSIRCLLQHTSNMIKSDKYIGSWVLFWSLAAAAHCTWRRPRWLWQRTMRLAAATGCKHRKQPLGCDASATDVLRMRSMLVLGAALQTGGCLHEYHTRTHYGQGHSRCTVSVSRWRLCSVLWPWHAVSDMWL